MAAMQVTVESIGGHDFSIDIRNTLTFDELQALIAIEMAVGPDVEILLALCNHALPRTSRLAVAVLGISNGSVLTVIKRLSPRVLTASWDETAKIWNFATGECLLTLFPYNVSRHVNAPGYGRLNHAWWQSDGSTIITESGSLNIWHATTGVCLDELSGHERKVLSGFVSPDGLVSLHTSVAGTCCVSNIETGAYVSTLVVGQ